MTNLAPDFVVDKASAMVENCFGDGLDVYRVIQAIPGPEVNLLPGE